MSKNNPNYRKYFHDNLKESMGSTDPEYKNSIGIFNGQIEVLSSKKGTIANPEKVELTITEDILVKNPLLQKILLGVRFTDQTVIKTTNNSFDITGRAIYVNKKLRDKCGIRNEDSINIECKYEYIPSSLTKTQRDAVKSGLLNAIISYNGSYNDYVEGSNCPVLSLKKVNKEDLTSYCMYDLEIEELVIGLVSKKVFDCPSMYPEISDINNQTELILYSIDPYRNRNHYNVILYLGKRNWNRIPEPKESEEDYKKRIIKNVNDTLDSPGFVVGLDGSFPYDQEYYRKRYVNRNVIESSRERKTPEANFCNENGTNYLYKIFQSNDRTECYISKWLCEEFNIESKLVFVEDVSSYSHVYQNLIPRICCSYTLSPYMREKIKQIYDAVSDIEKPIQISLSEIRAKMQRSCKTRKANALRRIKERNEEKMKAFQKSTFGCIGD